MEKWRNSINPFQSWILLVMISIGGVMKAQNPSTEKFYKLEKQWTEALGKQDTLLLYKLISPDFTLLGAGAKTDTPIINRTQYLGAVGNYNWPNREVKIINVQISSRIQQ